MKRIDISTNKFPETFALVDEQDFYELNRWKWNANRRRNTFYAMRRLPNYGKILLMHRVIILPAEGAVVDHINGNGLDNRRENLRECTPLENSWNSTRSRKSEKSQSKYRGVDFHKQCGRWRARIRVNPKVIDLGRFKSEVEAARAYNNAALKYHGTFAVLNFLEEAV